MSRAVVNAPRTSGICSHRRLVVLAEDEDDLRETLAEAIAETGCDVIAVADVPALRQVLSAHRPDVLLADFQLFDQTTEAVGTEVRGTIPAVAIVSAAPAARAIAERLAVEHIPKPFDLDRLLALVVGGEAIKRAG
jgi:DNA-binding NtrC family response regulator